MEETLVPRKGVSLMQRTRNALSDLFGQLMTRKFWGDLFRQVIKDMAFSLMASVGDSMMRFAKTKALAAGGSINTTTEASSPTSSAFSKGFHPQPTYNPSAALANTGSGYPGYPAR